MSGRYSHYRILYNSSKYYAPLRKSRNLKGVHQYETPRMRNPSAAQRAGILSVKHIWSYGDRFYKLADQYYGDPDYWWVIAWYNGVPTEAELYLGNLIVIPTDIQQALRVLGI